MHLHRSYTLFLLSVALLANAAPAPEAIVVPPSPMPLTDLAARELQRYLYLLSGELLPIRENCEGSCFAVDGPTVNPLVRELVADKALSWNPGRLGDQGYILSTVQHKGRTVTVAAGATPLATMYAVYDLLERYGFGFYLGGDALPEPRPLAFLELNDVCVPRFRIRGSLPWYNFLNSPTTWNLADHRRFYDQMAKMRMNFVGFHAYDYEPFTAVQLDGHWQFGQPLQNTRQNVWGALPMRTEEWGFGTSECFHREYFGADASLDYESFDEGITKAQRLLANGLAYARQRGIHVCVGFEVHGDPGDPRNEMMLEQRLRHLLATYPMIEYVWLWQAEGRGHGGDQPTPPRSTPFGNYYWQVRPAFEYLRQPQRIAEAARVSYYAHLGHRILRHFAPGVRLIVSGWGGDHWMRFSDFYVGMDKVLPEDVIFAALDNIDPSWSPEVSRAYGELSPSRERWPIPWFESDGGGSRRDQWGPQCNVKPFTELCRDALNKGCQGLLGIHWRTGGVEEVAAYVAQFAWNPELTYEDFYRGFAQRCFGPELAEEMGAILRQLESLGPRWTGALGQVECGGFQWFSSEHRPKPQSLQTLAAIEARLLTLRERIAPRHRDRLDYLIHMIRWVTRYDAAALQLQPGGPVEQAIAAAEAAQAAGAENAEELAKAALAALRSSGFGEALAERARLLRDQGDMGVLATVNGKAYAAYRALESRIAALLPQALPPEPPVLDDLELAVTVTPDRLYAAEPLTVQAIVRSDRPPVLPALCWRPLGSREEYRSVSMERLGRSVFAATVPAAQLEEPGVEFYVEAADAAGRHKRLPAAGPDGPWSACVVPYAVTRWPVPQPAPESGAACLALTAQSVGPFQVQLSWRPAPGTSPHHWEVRRRSGTDPTAGPTLIGEPRLPGFTDFRAASNRLHTYSVRPVLWNGATGEESTTEITTPQYPPPAAPKELTGTPGVRSALLRWGNAGLH